MKNLKKAMFCFVILIIAIVASCKKDKKVIVEPKIDPHGKIAISTRTYGKTGTNEDLYLIDLRDKNAPKKMIYEMVNLS